MAKYLHGRRQISGWPILPELGHNLTSGQKQKAAKLVTVEKTEKTKRSNMETVENMKKKATWRYCSESSGKMESMASPKPARFPIETNPGCFLSNLEDLNQVRSLVSVEFCCGSLHQRDRAQEGLSVAQNGRREGARNAGRGLTERERERERETLFDLFYLLFFDYTPAHATPTTK